MAFRLRFTPSAAKDLEAIADFIGEANPDAARKVCRQLYETAMSLRGHPWLGRITPEYDNPTIREIVRGKYRIVYRVQQEENLIEILRFWHGARGYLPDEGWI